MKLLALARKIRRFLPYFLLARKTWRWPRTSDVLIFDAAGHESLLDFLSPWNPEVLHLRGEQINIPVLMASLAGFGRLNRNAYIDRFVKEVRPRLIVTLIDNNPSFYSLARRHPSVKTLFIQNGTRTNCGDVFERLERQPSPNNGFRVDYMMTFGSHIGSEYSRFIAGSAVPMGSLKNNALPRRKATKAGTLAFISQYRDTKSLDIRGRLFTRAQCFEQADRFVLQQLIQYSREHNKQFSIISCASFHTNSLQDDQEKGYYRDLLGQDCDLTQERGRYASYEAADAAEVVVTIDSTLGYESAARGNKTAVLSVRLQPWGVRGLTFGWPGAYPDDGPFWTNRQDPSAVQRILDYLFSINGDEWRTRLKQHGFDNIMMFDPGNTVLRSVLRRELGAPPAE